MLAAHLVISPCPLPSSLQRITIPEIRQHPWFLQKIPSYLMLTPAKIEQQELRVDLEVVQTMLKLNFGFPVTEQRIFQIIREGSKKSNQGRRARAIRVAYELLIGNKHTQERLNDCVAASRRLANTPPAFTPHRHSASPDGAPSSRTRSGRERSLSREGEAMDKGSQRLAEAASILAQQTGSAGVDGGGSSRGGYLGHAGAADPKSLVAPAKRRRWYLGIQSKKDPAHVMTEVYRALLQLGCEWRMTGSYGLKCRWSPSGAADEYRVIAGLTLYKVQQNIYLLDFQRKEGDQFSFMMLCGKIITQLKTLSAASKAMQIQAGQMRGVDSRMLEAVRRDHPQQLPPQSRLPQPPGAAAGTRMPPRHDT
jgi:5'-AMP-activated protein kinase catalytic alpha subunit